MKACVIQHASCETPGAIADALAAAGVTVRYLRTFAGDRVPTELGDAAGLVVMGGPMGVCEQERYPFLSGEIRLIEQAVRDGRAVLGVCLGSQLLAAALGAAVTPGKKKEIGWHPVQLTPAAREDALWSGVAGSFMAYHWHGDVFELPRGAVALASSQMTSLQAFRYGEGAYGLLFHAEVTRTIVEAMVAEFAEELREARVDGAAILRQTEDHLPGLSAVARTVFRRWASLLP